MENLRFFPKVLADYGEHRTVETESVQVTPETVRAPIQDTTIDRNRKNRRRRTCYEPDKLFRLEQEYNLGRCFITESRKAKLVAELKISPTRITIWFQNKRAKERKKNMKKEKIVPTPNFNTPFWHPWTNFHQYGNSPGYPFYIHKPRNLQVLPDYVPHGGVSWALYPHHQFDNSLDSTSHVQLSPLPAISNGSSSCTSTFQQQIQNCNKNLETMSVSPISDGSSHSTDSSQAVDCSLWVNFEMSAQIYQNTQFQGYKHSLSYPVDYVNRNSSDHKSHDQLNSQGTEST